MKRIFLEADENPTSLVTTINSSEAKRLIKATKGKFFTVTFTKKDGTERVMNARLGVKQYLRGGKLPYDPEPKNLIPVWDPNAHKKTNNGYRMINIDTLTNLKIGNREFKVT